MNLSPFIFLGLALVCSDILMMLKCGYPCDRTFKDQRGLNRHRYSCPIYEDLQVNAVTRRRSQAKKSRIRLSTPHREQTQAVIANDGASDQVQVDCDVRYVIFL